MDLTQVALGTGLLAVSTLTFVGPAALESHVVYALTAIALVVGAGALLVNLAREATVAGSR
ncbi:hypothetical protein CHINAEXTREME_01175 [Halobiforma lacisalsi AJ5]|uniref:Uncharacterized protein n=2 Tax=Natronobacterium TaxID=2256 RepID=M0LH62_NATLA|nr:MULTISPECIES: hypothetical protein [Halobiforma]APW96460.1 hypothetical protein CHINAEXTREME_01175 [Halobiforma lacisalsi AJ5]EMA31769.1 hypothetical protein C445_13180 [Halobiforma lacisalsi AJ5]SFB70562.1 hypothetical protein SAMN05444422_101345 [Halobiforma haloterrestris]